MPSSFSSADLLVLLYLHAVDEHAEVLADRDQRRVLVVKLHAQRSVHRLRDFGNRGGRLVADLVGVDDRHPRHHDHHGLAVLALLGPGTTTRVTRTRLSHIVHPWAIFLE